MVITAHEGGREAALVLLDLSAAFNIIGCSGCCSAVVVFLSQRQNLLSEHWEAFVFVRRAPRVRVRPSSLFNYMLPLGAIFKKYKITGVLTILSSILQQKLTLWMCFTTVWGDKRLEG